MLKARNGSFYDANPKGEFYGKVPITYFSDAFQDILTRYGFFLFYGSLKRKKKKILILWEVPRISIFALS